MKEDILEQIVEDTLQKRGAFTRHNVKYHPLKKSKGYNPKTDSSSSDIDIIGIFPLQRNGTKKISVINCKSWQHGFDVKAWYNTLVKYHDEFSKSKKQEFGRHRWKHFRELTHPKWSKAFVEKIYEETKSSHFTYYIAVTRLIGKESKIFEEKFKKEPKFLNSLRKNKKSHVVIEFIKVENLVSNYFDPTNKSKTLESTDIGRLLQVLRAAKLILVPSNS